MENLKIGILDVLHSQKSGGQTSKYIYYLHKIYTPRGFW
jgi:hypothetical protein